VHEHEHDQPDAELDLRTGHLSQGDWRLIDRQLRAEAVAILRQIDELGAEPRPRPDGEQG